MAAIALGRVRDDHIEALVRDALTPRFREEPIAPLLGGLLSRRLSATTCTTGWSTSPSRSCTAGWSRTRTPSPRSSASGRPGGRRPRLNDAVTSRIHRELVDWVEDIRDDPRHHARQALDSVLAQLADDLLHDPDTQERAEALKERLLDNPAVIRSAISLWDALRRALTASLAGPRRRRTRSGC